MNRGDAVKRVEELTLKLLDGAADEGEIAELERLVSADDSSAAAHVALLEQEAALRGQMPGADLTASVMERIREEKKKRLAGRVLNSIRRRGRETGGAFWPVEPRLAWIGGRPFWNAVAAVVLIALIVVLIQARTVSTMQAMPLEAFVYGQWQVSPGAPGSYRIFVRNAETGEPVQDARATFALNDENGSPVWNAETRTDRGGAGLAEAAVPADLAEGDYVLCVTTTAGEDTATIERPVAVRRAIRIHVTTDKPLYQPGQTVHIRTLSLAALDGKPAAGREIAIEVSDPRGNRVFRRRIETSAFGVAAADFALADMVGLGRYTVAAVMEEVRSERTVTVDRYVLPRFSVDLASDAGFYLPGGVIKGTVDARYTFGEPVAGAEVRVRAAEFIEKFRPFAEVSGRTDAAGVFAFEIPLGDAYFGMDLKKGDALVQLEAAVVDAAGHEQVRARDVAVTAQPIRIEVIPESGRLVRGVENHLYVVTAYADGRPARTSLTIGATEQKIDTSDLGIARVKITPESAGLVLSISAEDGRGRKATVRRPLKVGDRPDGFLLRTDRAVYRAGETVELSVISTLGWAGVFIDVVKERQTVLTRAIDVADFEGRLDLDLPPDLSGTLEINAYRILPDGGMVGDTRVIQVNRPDDLAVNVTMDRETYLPAGEAVMKFLVRRAGGEPVQAALGLAGVDEAVFALGEMRPGLQRIYFMLQEELLEPRWDIHARLPLSPADVVEPPAEEPPGYREATVTLFAAAAGEDRVERAAAETYAERQQKIAAEKRAFSRKIWGIVVYIPAGLFFVLALPLMAYAVFRLFHRVPVGDLSPRTADTLRRPVRGLTWTWAAGVAAPPLIILANWIFKWDWGHDGYWSVLRFCFFAGLGIAIVASLTIYVRMLRRAPLSAAVPILRKLATPLPAAYVFGLIGATFLLGAANENRPAIDPATGLGLAIVLWLTAMLVTGAIAAAGRAAVERLAPVDWLLEFGGRAALAGIPLLILFTMILQEYSMEDSRLVADGGFPVPTSAAGRDWGGGIMMAESESEQSAPGGDATADAGGPSPVRVRRHFPETLLWIPELITDESGRAETRVPLADSITTWRIAASAVSAGGELGWQTAPLRVFQDFFVDVDFPAVLTQDDRVSVPVAVYNYLDREQTVRLEVSPAPWFRLGENTTGGMARSVTVGPRGAASVPLDLTVLEPGRHTLTVTARGDGAADAVERSVRVEPNGRPVTLARSGILAGGPGGGLRHEFTVPGDAVRGSESLLLKIYPGAFSQVVEGLDAILRLPHGCFEQTSSTTYPNVLALSYMRATGTTSPEVEMRALDYIGLGYQRLLTFEVGGGGFDWYGNPPADIALSAFGLMEFSDMARVCDIDTGVIDRTREWLFLQQDNDGSWPPSTRGFNRTGDAAGDGRLRLTAYTAWALTAAWAEAAARNPTAARNRADDARFDPRLGRALDFIAAGARGTEDPYTLALCAGALTAGGRPQEAADVLEWLHGFRTDEDQLTFWRSPGEGITHSRGRYLDIETTALAAYAYLRAGFEVPTAHRALAWLISQKDPAGTWHSTQATVLALRTLLRGAETATPVTEPIAVNITVNGRDAGTVAIAVEDADILRLVPLTDYLKPGANTLELGLPGEGGLAYQIAAAYHVPHDGEGPAQPEDLSIDVDYDTRELRADDVLTARVTVQYNRPGAAMMTIVDLGVPPGFSLDRDSLETLKADGVIERYSATARQAILYFREIRSGEPVAFDLRMRARYPVRVKTRPAAVYQYYEPSLRDETEPVELIVR